MATERKPVTPNMQKIINFHAVALGGVGGLCGLFGPGVDLPIIFGSWTTMTIQLAAEAGKPLERQTAKKILSAVCAGAGIFVGGTKAASLLLSWALALPTLGASLAISAGANAALNSSFTYAYGRAAASVFLSDADITNTELVVRMMLAIITGGGAAGFDAGAGGNVA